MYPCFSTTATSPSPHLFDVSTNNVPSFELPLKISWLLHSYDHVSPPLWYTSRLPIALEGKQRITESKGRAEKYLNNLIYFPTILRCGNWGLGKGSDFLKPHSGLKVSLELEHRFLDSESKFTFLGILFLVLNDKTVFPTWSSSLPLHERQLQPNLSICLSSNTLWVLLLWLPLSCMSLSDPTFPPYLSPASLII